MSFALFSGGGTSELLWCTDETAQGVEDLQLRLAAPRLDARALAEHGTRCVDLLAVAAAGVLLADAREELQLLAASDERARLLE